MFDDEEHVSRNVQVDSGRLEVSGRDKYLRVIHTNVIAKAVKISGLP